MRGHCKCVVKLICPSVVDMKVILSVYFFSYSFYELISSVLPVKLVSQASATEPHWWHWWQINIGSGNSLLPSGNTRAWWRIDMRYWKELEYPWWCLFASQIVALFSVPMISETVPGQHELNASPLIRPKLHDLCIAFTGKKAYANLQAAS